MKTTMVSDMTSDRQFEYITESCAEAAKFHARFVSLKTGHETEVKETLQGYIVLENGKPQYWVRKTR